MLLIFKNQLCQTGNLRTSIIWKQYLFVVETPCSVSTPSPYVNT